MDVIVFEEQQTSREGKATMLPTIETDVERQVRAKHMVVSRHCLLVMNI
jgi:hypothetical protein